MVEDKEENWPVALGMTGPRRLLLWLECFSPQSLSDLEPEWFRLILVSSNATSTGWSSHSPSSIAVSHYPRCPFYDSPWSREVSLSGSPSHRAADSELRRKNTCFISLPFFLGGDNSRGPLLLQSIGQGLSYTLLKGQDFLLPSSAPSAQNRCLWISSPLPGGFSACSTQSERLSCRREPNISGTSVYLGVLIRVLRCLLG